MTETKPARMVLTMPKPVLEVKLIVVLSFGIRKVRICLLELLLELIKPEFICGMHFGAALPAPVSAF